MSTTPASPPPVPPHTAKLDIAPKLLIDNWRAEMDATTLYRSLARREREPERATILLEMATTEERHAGVMAARLKEMGIPLPKHGLGLRTRLIIMLSRIFGPRALLPVIESMEAKGVDAYRQPEQDPAVQALAADERGHFRAIGRMARGGPTAPTPVVEIAQHERWHRSGGGGTLRASIFGVSDGLVSNLSLVMGFAGAQAESKFVLLAGIAGLLAGAGSMAAGEYVSMRSQREMYEYQIGLEREELALYPEEEQEELALIYAARGVPRAQARALAAEMLRDPEHALDTLSREELGLNPENLGSPWGAAAFSFISFGAGALVPLLPFLFLRNTGTALPVAGIVAALGLAAVGAALSLFSGKSAVWGGLRMLGIGAAAGAATYLIGKLIGVSLS